MRAITKILFLITVIITLIIIPVSAYDENIDLVKFASEYDSFSDMFRGNCINCQADVIRDYVKKGRNYIMEGDDVKEFIELMNK